MAACSLTLLGGFGLRSADGRELALSTRKDRLLLAYLALNAGRSLARDRLAGLLWGDRGETQARDSLRQSIAAIRHTCRQVTLDPIASERDSVNFSCDGIEIDAVAFERLAAEPATWPDAATLYRGALLEGIDGITPEYEAWLAPERERLAALAVRLVENIATTAQPSETALCLSRQLLARDPVCEPLHRTLMRLHVAAGDRATALKLYAVCRDTLKRELDTVPDLQTEMLYRNILTDRPAQQAPMVDSARATERPSIAVLPFSNLSRDPDLDHLCEGLAEDIITGLGRFRLLFVIDRYSSSMIVKQETDIAEIGRRLGVAHLVQGSLQRQGDRVRITVRLLDAATRAQVWGESYDHPFADLTTIPDTITRALTSTLHGRVESALLAQVRRKPKMAAYECLLRGLKHLRGYGPGDNQRAVELFQQAVDLDPDYARARAYRAFADVVLYGYSDAPDEILDRSHAMATTALELDETDGRCQFLVGLIQRYRGDMDSAERHYQRALELNPNDADVIVGYGRLLAFRGQLEQGLDRVMQGMRLNPYHPEWYWLNLASVLYEAGRYADAAAALSRITKPGYWVLCRLAGCYAELGRMEEARETAANALRLRPNFRVGTLRLRECPPAIADRIRGGLRKAGLPG
ncbi:tetratricopeptide repeat protein [Dongia deserti]|uniref:tetratricopeptide repeat protein n=1 Tax=Dongia deserti TaxID=2268030 RepID=UPI0013C484D0|nr:tetratricopeptide repeat protein [Dongia deserti]